MKNFFKFLGKLLPVLPQEVDSLQITVQSPIVEFQTEGEVFGKGVKAFTIAGPVILYGIFTSWLLGVIYWIVSIW